MTIRGAIFDMDGTLMDSMFVWKDIGVRYVLSMGLTPPDNLTEKISNMSMQQVSDFFSLTFGLAKTPQQIMGEINLLVEPLYRNKVSPKPGVARLLELFKSLGVKMCVATATDRHLAEIVLKKTGLVGYFSEIFTCSGVGAGKDEPLIYERSLEHLATEKCETYVFEDALYAIKTAKSAGFKIVGVYDRHSETTKEKIIELSDIYLPDYGVEYIKAFQ